MGSQSAVLGFAFGTYYEAGKRMVRAMDNDFFNKVIAGVQDPINVVYDGKEETIAYGDYLSWQTKNVHGRMITEFREAIPEFMSLQNDIVEQFVQIEKQKIAMVTPELLAAWINLYAEQSNNAITAVAKLILQGFGLTAEQIEQYSQETPSEDLVTFETTAWHVAVDEDGDGNFDKVVNQTQTLNFKLAEIDLELQKLEDRQLEINTTNPDWAQRIDNQDWLDGAEYNNNQLIINWIYANYVS